jgi:hypothetical protein
MTRTIQEVFERAVAQIGQQMVTILPPLLVGLAVLTVAVLLAGVARKVCLRLFKGAGVDRFLSESGFAGFLPGTSCRGRSRCGWRRCWRGRFTGRS